MAQQIQRKRKRRRMRRERRVVLVLLILVFLAACVAALSSSFMSEPQVSTPALDEPGHEDSLRREGAYNILVCGVDDGNGGSDTIMMVSVNTEQDTAHVVSIPRDTLVNEDWTVKKINSAFNRGGIEGVQKQVAKIMGFPVDFYVTVDLKAFIELVDAIKGVDFEVPIAMNYDDPAQDLHIHFEPGMQHLDGQQAMEVVRFRHNNDGGGYPLQDLDRIKTQQAFLKTVADKMFSLSSVTKIPEFTRIFFDNVETDLTLGEMVWFGNEVKDMGAENIQFSTLPGAPNNNVYGGAYYVIDADACLELINSGLNPYKEDLVLEDLDIKTVG